MEKLPVFFIQGKTPSFGGYAERHRPPVHENNPLVTEQYIMLKGE